MKKIIFLIITLIFSFTLADSVFAVGQIVKPIIIEDVLRGQEFKETLILANSEDKEIVYQLEARGDIEKWTTFYNIEDSNLENPITEIKIPSQSFIEVSAKFLLPESLPNGEYYGTADVVFKPQEDSDSIQSKAVVSQRVGRPVKITVTDKEIIELDISVIPEQYDVRKGESLKIKIAYDNNGNIELKPDVQLKILKEGKTIFNAIFPYPENNKPISPKTREIVPTIDWPTVGQEKGIYRAEITVLYRNEVLKQEDFKFTIGYVKNNLLAGIAFLGGGNIVLAWFVIGIILLILAAVINLLYFKKKINKKGFNLKGFNLKTKKTKRRFKI